MSFQLKVWKLLDFETVETYSISFIIYGSTKSTSLRVGLSDVLVNAQSSTHVAKRQDLVRSVACDPLGTAPSDCAADS